MALTIDVPAVSPTQWGAQIDYDAKSWGPWNPDKLVVHWGGPPGVTDDAAAGDVAAEAAQLRRWESFHLGKGWAGLAYNWAIGNSGTLYRCRGNNRSAATSGDQEPDGIPENFEAVAVVFIVGEKNNQPQPVTPAALATFQQFYRDVGLERVIRHKDASTTQCPGPQLSAWVAAGGYLEGNDMGYYIPETPDDSPESIEFLQRGLNRVYGAGLDIDGQWGPATGAAKAEHLGGDPLVINSWEAVKLLEAWIEDRPPREHSNNAHTVSYATAEALTMHTSAGHTGGWDEARIADLEAQVAALAGHVHDEGETGPPLSGG